MYAKLDTEFHFDWDVAANTANHLVVQSGDHADDARRWFGPGAEHEDGLAVDWAQQLRYVARRPGSDPPRPPTLFMNPPYSKEEGLLIEPWLQKAWRESARGCTVVGVIPYNPQTAAFREYAWGEGTEHAAMELRILSHRVDFLRGDGSKADNAPGNTCVVIWKPNPGYVDVWQPVVRYWSYREGAVYA